LTATLDSAFLLRARTKGPLVSFSLDGYGAYRRGELSRVILRYRNEGDSDVIAPIFKVEAPSSVRLRLREDDELRTNALLILGIDEENVAGRLSPGSRWHEVHVYFLSDRQNSTELKASILTEADTDTLDWSSLPAPAGLSASQWSNLRAKLANRAGNSWRELHESLAAAATRLHARGDDATDVATLFRFLSREALDLPSSSVSGRVLDLSTGEPVKGAEVLARFGGNTESYGATNGDGRFTIDWLRSGRSYSLDIRDWTSNVVTAVIPANGGDTLGVELLAAVQADSLSAAAPTARRAVCRKSRSRPTFQPLRRRSLPPPRGSALRGSERKARAAAPGHAGHGRHHLRGRDEVGYQIRFENIGAAAAVHVVVRDVVEGVALERRKFRFVEVELPGVTFPLTTLVEGGVYTPATQDYGASETVEGVGVGGGVCVVLSGAYDPLTGALEVHLDAVDPLTGAAPELPTLGVVAQGEHGSVSFAVGAKDGSMAEPEEDTEVKNSGDITFDSNPPIHTNTFVNQFSRCEPGTPHSPVPADDVARGQGTELALGWACDPADSFDVYLGVAGTPRTLRAFRAARARVQADRPPAEPRLRVAGGCAELPRDDDGPRLALLDECWIIRPVPPRRCELRRQPGPVRRGFHPELSVSRWLHAGMHARAGRRRRRRRDHHGSCRPAEPSLHRSAAAAAAFCRVRHRQHAGLAALREPSGLPLMKRNARAGFRY
jgi:hypothetical protein